MDIRYMDVLFSTKTDELSFYEKAWGKFKFNLKFLILRSQHEKITYSITFRKGKTLWRQKHQLLPWVREERKINRQT